MPYKRENLSLNPQDPGKSQVHGESLCNHRRRTKAGASPEAHRPVNLADIAEKQHNSKGRTNSHDCPQTSTYKPWHAQAGVGVGSPDWTAGNNSISTDIFFFSSIMSYKTTLLKVRRVLF